MKPKLTYRFGIYAAALLTASVLSATVAAAPIEPEERGSAVVAGVRVNVTADAWSGVPMDIGKIQPLLVSIQNDSTMPIRVRYEQFSVVGPGGDRVTALPPFEIRGTALVDPAFAPGPYPYSVNGFWVAPYLSRYYPGLRPFGGPFYYDPWYYSTYYPTFARVSLPTTDMIVQALPEGVLEPGGRLTGFVYIENKPRSGKEATFVFDLIGADHGERFGHVQIPLEVD